LARLSGCKGDASDYIPRTLEGAELAPDTSFQET